jgi:hypothetical protein
MVLGLAAEAIEDQSGELFDDLFYREAAIAAVPAMHPVTHPDDGKRRHLHIEIGRELPDLHSLAEDLLPELFIPLGAFLHVGVHGVYLQEVVEVDKEIGIVRIKGTELGGEGLCQFLCR